MIEIIALSPGIVCRPSRERGMEARLYLTWLWREQVELRLLGCCGSILMRPFEWLFPIARVNGRWVRLGADVKPRQLRERLGLPIPDGYACVVVRAGQPVFAKPEANEPPTQAV